MPQNDDVIRWLAEGDASLRWQVKRDLLGAGARAVARERAKVAREGWGARLLALQDEEGTWAGGLYTPKWTSTTYTMLLLRRLGLPPDNRQALRACELLWDRGFRDDGGVNFSPRARHAETCVTGMVLSILAYFRYDDGRLDRIAAHLLDRQMADGGWNCRLPYGASHGSCHTTISVLEGLREYERGKPRKVRDLRRAARGGREFLLRHRLYKSDRTGEVIHPSFTRLSFPPRWHYDVLRGLDYFRGAGARRDPRLEDAVELLLKKRRPDGTWPLPQRWPGRTFFELEKTGRPSRWNTLRALRVEKWWRGE